MSYSHKIKNKRGQKGVSIFLSIIILTIILGIALGISTISVFQIKMIKGMGDSVTSFFAADTGMERILYEDKICRLSNCSANCASLGCSCVDSVNCDDGRSAGTISGSIGGAAYQVDFNDGASTISSQGMYKETRRAIQVTRVIP